MALDQRHKTSAISYFVLFLFVEFYEQAVNMGSQQGSWSIPEDQSLG